MKAPQSSARPVAWISGCALLFLVAAVILPLIGPTGIDLQRVFAKAAPDYGIFVELRITRVLLGLLAGGALALGGGLFQAMLRDSLATPYTLGVSAGAALGAVLVLALDLERILGFPALWLGSIAGAAVVLALVAGASWKGGHISGVRLLLTGISLNSICSAFILLIYGVVRERRSFSITQWLLGSVDSVSYTALGIFAVAVAVSCTVLLRQARAWNLIAIGESWAASRGVDLRRVMLTGYVCGSVLTAGAIALTGPIGFVGLIVPHVVRSRISPDNRLLLPCSFLLGGVMLAACDAIGRVVLAPAELPAGAVMAVIGGPYLIWVVRRRF
jgi:iron complex transport system permease protein